MIRTWNWTILIACGTASHGSAEGSSVDSTAHMIDKSSDQKASSAQSVESVPERIYKYFDEVK